MRNPQRDAAGELTWVGAEPPQLAYASDVQVSADSGGVQLTFTRVHPVKEDVASGDPSLEEGAHVEIIAQVVMPPLAARRLLRLLPGGLDQQQMLADKYARETERDAPINRPPAWPDDPADLSSDPLLIALEDAEVDDEPYPDEQRAAARHGWEEYSRGETVPWEQVKRALFEADDSSAEAKS